MESGIYSNHNRFLITTFVLVILAFLFVFILSTQVGEASFAILVVPIAFVAFSFSRKVGVYFAIFSFLSVLIWANTRVGIDNSPFLIAFLFLYFVTVFIVSAYASFARQSQQINQAVSRSQFGPLAAKDLFHRYVFVNAGAAEIMGMSIKDILGKKTEELMAGKVDEESLQRMHRLEEKVIRDKKPIVTEEEFILHGKLIVYKISRDPILDENNQVSGILISSEEITEKHLKEKESRLLASIVEGASDAIISLDLEEKVSTWNKGAERLFGWSEKEMIGRKLVSIYPKYLLEEREELLQKSIRGIPTRDLETKRLHKNGEEIPVIVTVSPIYNEDKDIVGISKIIGDLRDLYKKEEAHRILSSTLETAEDAIYYKNKDKIIETWNIGAEKMFLYKKEEIIGKSEDILIPEDCREREEKLRQERLKGNSLPKAQQILTWRLCRDNKRIPVSITISPSQDRNFNIIGDSTIARDITERLEQERKLKEDARYFEVSHDLICTLNDDGVVLSLNKRWHETLQYKESCLKGRNIISICVDKKEFIKEEFQQLNRIQIKDNNGELRWLEWSGTFVEEEKQLYAAARDVTQEVKAEKLKDEFFALVSHELRTPLASILGYLEIMQEDEQLTDYQKTNLKVIDRNSKRLLRLVGDLLFVARLESGQEVTVEKTDIDLDEIIRDSIDSFSVLLKRKNINVEYHSPGSFLWRGDYGRLGQVMDNLLSNAIKFTPPSGEICVETGLENNNAIIRVLNNGEKIEDKDVQHLFDRFYRSEAAVERQISGVGLGLTICDAIVKKHNGNIEVYNNEQTEFKVVLPWETDK